MTTQKAIAVLRAIGSPRMRLCVARLPVVSCSAAMDRNALQHLGCVLNVGTFAGLLGIGEF
jgi:hypothetical protein